MDYPDQRQEYLKNLNKYCNLLVLNEKLLKFLRKDFSQSMEGIESEESKEKTNESNKLLFERTKKTYILTELTKNRYSCSQVIKLLKDSEEEKNSTLANILEGFNTSPGRKSFGDEIEIEMTKTSAADARGQESMVYPMTQKPRGKALIINNVKHLTQRESYRFEHIFKELSFDVEELEFDLTAEQIKEKVNQLRVKIQNDFQENEVKPQAVIVMVISHGEDENVLGINACKGENDNDVVSTKTIVDEFNKGKFDFDEQFVRLFFFTCCRIKTITGELRDTLFGLTSKTEESKDTMKFYSSAEGFETFTDYKFSYFGKYLSESIAQYANKEDLTQIMNRTIGALRMNWGSNGYFLPEFRALGLRSSVYFNPGLP